MTDITVQVLDDSARAALAFATRAETAAGAAEAVVESEDVVAVAEAIADPASNLNAVGADLRTGGTMAAVRAKLTEIEAAPQAATDAAASASIASAAAVGSVTRRNIISDPLFTTPLVGGSALGLPRISGSATISTRAASPYSALGRSFQRAASSGTVILSFYAHELGMAAGDSLKAAIRLFGQAGQNVSWLASYYNARGVALSVNNTVIGVMACDATSKLFKTGVVTPPTGWYRVDFAFANHSGATGAIAVDAIWAEKTSTATLPDDPINDYEVPPPLLTRRLTDVEAGNPLATRLQVERFGGTVTITEDHSGATVGNAPGSGYSGYGQEITPQATTFNAVGLAGVAWNPAAANPPSWIEVVVSTSATATLPYGTAGATILARGRVAIDPEAGITAADLIIPLRDPSDPINGALISVASGVQLDRLFVGYYGVNASGGLAETIGAINGIMADRVGTNGLLLAPSGAWSAWNSPIALRLLSVPSFTSTLRPGLGKAGRLVDEIIGSGVLTAAPLKLHGVVGKEMSLYFDSMMFARKEDINFECQFLTSSYRGQQLGERWTWTVNGAVTNNIMTIIARRAGGPPLSTQTISINAVTAATATGTYVGHFIGDSLTEYGERLRAMSDIQAADLTKITFIGTKALASPYGAVRHDGYAGQPVTALLAATIAGYGANPFYNPATSAFDYAYFLSNGGHATPNFIDFYFGPNDMSGIASDAAAYAAANRVGLAYETMITSIRTVSSTIRVIINGPVPSGRDEDGFGSTTNVRGPQWRMNRNLKILFAVLRDRFSGREGSFVYFSPAGMCVDTEIGYRRAGQTPKHAGVKVTGTFATVAAMMADLSPADGLAYYVTNAAMYFIKVGPTTLGTWRPASPDDGFVRRLNDTVHLGDIGAWQCALLEFALIKAVL